MALAQFSSTPAGETQPWPQLSRHFWEAALHCGVAALLAFAVVGFAPPVLGDGDTYWHVSAGDWMLRHRQVLRADPFSFTFAGQPWHAHEWLAEIFMALAYRLAGWSGVLVLAGAASALAAGLLYGQLRLHVGRLTAAVSMVLVFGCLAPSLLARPHLFAIPLLVVWTSVLMKARSAGRAPSLLWLPLVVLWANMHGTVLLGVALVAPFALEALLEAPDKWRRTVWQWGLFGLGALVAATLTPRGLEGLIFSVKLTQMHSLATIVEWRSPDFQALPPVEIAILAALFVLLSRGAKIPPVRLGLLLVLLHMTLQHIRHEVPLAIVGSLLIAEALGHGVRSKASPESQRHDAKWLVAAPVLGAALIALRLVLPAEPTDGQSSPRAALSHVPAVLKALPVFNGYAVGGFLIANGVKPFIDGRTDMYGDVFNDKFDQAVSNPERLADALTAYQIGWTLLPPDSPAVASLDRLAGWRRLYADRYAVIHVRNAQH